LLKFGIKDILLALGYMAYFLFLPCRHLEGCRAHRGKGLYNPRVHATPFVLEEESEEGTWMFDLDVGLGNSGCSVHSTASDSRVLCVWPVTPLRRST
jgi:hypothetical protein